MASPRPPHTVIVLGGGIGGVVAARTLRRILDPADRVVLVERDPVFRYAPSLLWVMAGMRESGSIERDIRRLRRHGIEVVEAEVVGIDAAERTVETTAGTLEANALVVALGVGLAPEALDGFAETASNIYTVDGALDAHRALDSLPEGRVAVVVGGAPYKCPAAPYEAAFLADALLRRRGVRQKTTVDVYAPESLPMPVAGREVGTAIVELAEERGIGFHGEHSAARMDPATRTVTFADGSTVEADLVLGVPPHRPPAVLAASGLAPAGGYVPVDPRTLSFADGVSVIGDAAAVTLPDTKLLPKAGVFAEAEAATVARRIAEELAGQTPTSVFDGHGSCFVELGAGRAAYAGGNFFDPQGPRVAMHRPGRHWHLAKLGFNRYWLARWT